MKFQKNFLRSFEAFTVGLLQYESDRCSFTEKERVVHNNFWHLIRTPIPIDSEMPYIKDGALEPDNITRAFPTDPFEQLLLQILIAASHDNESGELVWSGANAAYIERWASAWWAIEVRRPWYWFLKLFWFPRSWVMFRINLAMRNLLAQKIVEEMPEWDLIEPEESSGYASNQNMPVYYPTPELIHRLNETLV